MKFSNLSEVKLGQFKYVSLSATEIQDRGQKLAQKLDELEVLEVNKKCEAKRFGQQIEAVKGEIRELTLTVRTGEEKRVEKLWDEDLDD